MSAIIFAILVAALITIVIITEFAWRTYGVKGEGKQLPLFDTRPEMKTV